MNPAADESGSRYEGAVTNPKSLAWDHVGFMFWELGRATAKPDEHTIESLLEGLGAGSEVLIVGASTQDLVLAALERGVVVTVIDFSRRMCEDLARALDGRPVDIAQADITGPCDVLGGRRFTAVLSERLINRFTFAELDRALRTMGELVRADGQIRTTVKHGFYPMDLRLLEQGRADGSLDRFYDPGTRTIDYAAAAHLLKTALVPHGAIPEQVLIQWYLGRGRESRFYRGDVEGAVRRSPDLRLVACRPLPGPEDTALYVIAPDASHPEWRQQ